MRDFSNPTTEGQTVISLPDQLAKARKALVALSGAVAVVAALYFDAEQVAAIVAFLDSALVWLTPNAE
jgi:hypothetical protein